MAKKMICSSCGSVGKPVKDTKGSCLVELILWCLMILPGLIYTVWRLTTTKDVCKQCKQPTLVPLNSPIGKKMLEMHHE